jgi:methionyl-tRNA formyltransferase
MLRTFLFVSENFGRVVLDGLSKIRDVKVLGLTGPLRQPESFRVRVARFLGSEKVLTTPYRTVSARLDQLGPEYFAYDRFRTMGATLREMKLDAIFSCGFPKLIPDDLLNAARHAINFHPGLLPERPGGTPVRWAVRLGDPVYGVTAHYMTNRFDAGDILARVELPLMPGSTTGEAEQRLLPEITSMVREVASKIARGDTLPRHPQPAGQTMPSLKGRLSRIDWTKDTSDSIARLVRAMKPRSGAVAHFRDRPIIIYDVKATGKGPDRFPPGTVCIIDPEGPRIATIDGSIVIHEVLRGGRPVSADFIKSQLRIGDQLT